MARTSLIQFNEEIVSFRKTSYHVIHVITTESDANEFACGSFFCIFGTDNPQDFSENYRKCKYLENGGSDNFEVGDKPRCIDCIPGG